MVMARMAVGTAMDDGKPAILVLGAGGHGKAVLDLVLAQGGWRAAGVVDAAPKVATLLGVPVLGDESLLPGLAQSGIGHAHPAIGNNAQRIAAAARLRAAGFALPALLHPAAILGHGAVIGEGVAVLARAVIGPEAQIGRLALVNTGAIVEHDCVVGAFSHCAPGSILCGGVTVGEDCHIGAGAVIREGVRLGDRIVVGAGAVVVRDCPDAGAVLLGAPARRREAK